MQIEDYVRKAKENGGSDIHLICGIPPKYRVSGQLEDMFPEALTEESCIRLARELSGERYQEE